MTDEHKLNISLAIKKAGNVPPNHTGKKRSDETRKKMSEAMTGLKRSEQTKEKIRLANIGRKHTEETKKKISDANKGTLFSEETRRKIGDGHKGEKCHFWKGGISSENELIRKTLEYKLWRTAVFERDDYTCRFCLVKGGKLNADHIKRFSEYPELRFAIDNGRTLCVECHRKTDTWGRPKKR